MAGQGGDLSTGLEREDQVCYTSQLVSRSLNIKLDEINLFLKLMSIRADTKVNNKRMHKRVRPEVWRLTFPRGRHNPKFSEAPTAVHLSSSYFVPFLYVDLHGRL